MADPKDPYPAILEGARQQEANPPDNYWRGLLSLPEERRNKLLGRLSPAARQGLNKLLPTLGLTQGEQYRFRQILGVLPQVSQTTLLPPATPQQTTAGRAGQAVGSVISGQLVGRVRQRLGEVAHESGQLAEQSQQAAQGPTVAQGKVTGERGFGELVVNDLMSKLYDTTEVGAKLAAGLTDPKTLAAFIVSKLGPEGALAATMYFGYQGTQGLADAIRSGQLTPESLQNGLLSMAGITGSVGMAGEAGTGRPVPTNLTELKQRGVETLETVRPYARRLSGARGALRKQVFKEAQQYPVDVKNQAEAVRTAEGIQESQRQLETHSRKAKANVEGVEHRAWNEGNQRFQQTRELVGAGEMGEPELPSQPLLDSVREAEAGLEGHPESIPLFRQIVKLEGDKATVSPGELRRATMEKHGIQGAYKDLADDEKRSVDQLAAQEMQGQPVTWDKLQRIKTSAEEAMRKPSTSPVIKQALRAVDEKAVEMMGQMADSKGPLARASWQGARDFWREWREDFHTSRGPMGSRSPLAGIRHAVDANMITGEINRTQGVDIGSNRASATLRKPMYAKHGGAEAADSVDQVVRTHRDIKATPPPGPAKLQPVGEPVVNAETVSRRGIEDMAAKWGTMNRRDLGIVGSGAVGAILKVAFQTTPAETASSIGGAWVAYEGVTYAVPQLLEKPGVQAWLLKRVPPEEMTALRKIPGADRVRVINTITDMGVEAARRGIIRRATRGGKTIDLSPDLQNFIGDANVQRIVAAAPSSRSPGQQLRDLRSIQEKFSDNPHMPIGPGQ